MLYKRRNEKSPTCHFQTEKIFQNPRTIWGPCLQPLNLKVSLKVSKKNMNYHFTLISFMKGSSLCITANCKSHM